LIVLKDNQSVAVKTTSLKQDKIINMASSYIFIKKITAILRGFTSMVHGKIFMSYHTRLLARKKHKKKNIQIA